MFNIGSIVDFLVIEMLVVIVLMVGFAIIVRWADDREKEKHGKIQKN